MCNLEHKLLIFPVHSHQLTQHVHLYTTLYSCLFTTADNVLIFLTSAGTQLDNTFPYSTEQGAYKAGGDELGGRGVRADNVSDVSD